MSERRIRVSDSGTRAPTRRPPRKGRGSPTAARPSTTDALDRVLASAAEGTDDPAALQWLEALLRDGECAGGPQPAADDSGE